MKGLASKVLFDGQADERELIFSDELAKDEVTWEIIDE